MAAAEAEGAALAGADALAAADAVAAAEAVASVVAAGDAVGAAVGDAVLRPQAPASNITTASADVVRSRLTTICHLLRTCPGVL